MESIKIIAVSILLAIIYGICHDMITAHISIEYFTIGHPRIIESESPFHLALLWGIIATWWVGLVLGIFITVASRIGQRPKFGLKEIINQMVKLILIMGCLSILGGFVGYFLAIKEVFQLVDRLALQIDPDKHHLFLSVGWAHTTSYIVGIVGGIVICMRIWRKRKLVNSNI